MTLETARAVLAWSTLFNLAFLLLWFGMYACARDFIHRMHGRWFRLAPEQFDLIHYSGMAIYKLGIILFNLMPYLALHVVG